jgi:stage V sporulation protein B
VVSLFAKPLLSALVMGFAAWAVYGLAARVVSSNGVCTLLSILVAGCVYLALALALGAITKDELSLMPKGDKIARILHIS